MLTKILLIFSLIGFAGAADEPFEQTVFRVDNRVYFASDVEELLKELNGFSCLYPASKLLGSLQLNSLPKIPFAAKEVDYSEYRSELIKLIRLFKLRQFVLNQGGGTASKKLTAGEIKKCGLDKRMHYLPELMRVEIFLQDRFTFKEEMITQRELLQFQKEHPQWERRRVKEMLAKDKQSKIDQSLALFLKTIDKKIGHNVYF